MRGCLWGLFGVAPPGSTCTPACSSSGPTFLALPAFEFASSSNHPGQTLMRSAARYDGSLTVSREATCSDAL